MAYLVDTNVLLRFTQRVHPDHGVTRVAVRKLHLAGETLFFTAQNMAEFWSAATRAPSARGGFGLTTAEADRAARLIERLFMRLPDTEAAYNESRRTVVAHRVVGTQVHDSRLAAAMIAHGVTHILTFNTSDFVRYTGITAVDPSSL